jgi:hypothetical protein
MPGYTRLNRFVYERWACARIPAHLLAAKTLVLTSTRIGATVTRV